MFSCGGSIFDFAKGKEKKEGRKVGREDFGVASSFVGGHRFRFLPIEPNDCIITQLHALLVLIFPFEGVIFFQLLLVLHGGLRFSQLLWCDAAKIVLEPALGLGRPSTLVYSKLAEWSPSASPCRADNSCRLV